MASVLRWSRSWDVYEMRWEWWRIPAGCTGFGGDLVRVSDAGARTALSPILRREVRSETQCTVRAGVHVELVETVSLFSTALRSKSPRPLSSPPKRNIGSESSCLFKITVDVRGHSFESSSLWSRLTKVVAANIQTKKFSPWTGSAALFLVHEHGAEERGSGFTISLLPFISLIAGNGEHWGRGDFSWWPCFRGTPWWGTMTSMVRIVFNKFLNENIYYPIQSRKYLRCLHLVLRYRPLGSSSSTYRFTQYSG